MSSGPGYAKHPEHMIETRPAKQRVRVMVGGEPIADSADAIALYEAGRGPTWYLPRADVKMERLERTTHASHCRSRAMRATSRSRTPRAVRTRYGATNIRSMRSA